MGRCKVGKQLGVQPLGLCAIVGKFLNYLNAIPCKHIEQSWIHNVRVGVLDNEVAQGVDVHSGKGFSGGSSLFGESSDAVDELRFAPFINVICVVRGKALTNLESIARIKIMKHFSLKVVENSLILRGFFTSSNTIDALDDSLCIVDRNHAFCKR